MSSLFGGVSGRLALAMFGSAAALVAANSALYTVPPGHRAFLESLNGGVQPEVYGEGLHICVPVLHTPRLVDVRMAPMSFGGSSQSKGLADCFEWPLQY